MTESMDTFGYKEKDELTLLKERADFMGIKYHPTIGVEKLKEKLNAVLVPVKEKPLTAGQLRMEGIKKANRLVRIRVLCMDENKKGYKGQWFSVMNSTFGSVKKYVPFNTIWHVPHVIMKQIKRKKRQEFYEVKGKYGMKIKRARMVPMYAVEELPPLTVAELKTLAEEQSVNRSIDS